MSLRTLPILAAVGFLLTVGCLGAPVASNGTLDGHSPNPDEGTQVPQPNERPPDPRDLPTPSDPITAMSVGPFVADYEETRLHNELVEANPYIVTIGVSCSVESVEPVADSYAVTVACGHWYEFAEGENRGIADGAPYTITYTVDGDGGIDVGERDPTV